MSRKTLKDFMFYWFFGSSFFSYLTKSLSLSEGLGPLIPPSLEVLYILLSPYWATYRSSGWKPLKSNFEIKVTKPEHAKKALTEAI